MTVKRQVSYHWRLREVMATHGLFNASDLVPLLAERGITLSAVQVWRLVTQIPERLSLPVLAVLCDILEVSPAQLIATGRRTPARSRRPPMPTELEPFVAMLLADPRCETTRSWLYNPRAAERSGQRELSHAALSSWPHASAARYLRHRLIACGLLPPVDRYLVHTEVWLHRGGPRRVLRRVSRRPRCGWLGRPRRRCP